MNTRDAFASIITEAAERAATEAARLAVDGMKPFIASGADQAPPKAWMTNREARDYLGVSSSTLARWRSDGILSYSKVGQAIFYRLVDVEALLESGRTATAGGRC